MLTKYFAIQSNVVAVHAVMLVDFVALQAMIMIMTIMMNQRQWSKVKSETAVLRPCVLLIGVRPKLPTQEMEWVVATQPLQN